LIYSSYSGTEVSNCPERFLFSPVELFEMSLESFFPEENMGTPSFEEMYYMGNWMNQRYTEI
jgi:hypothetical protein